MNDAMKQAGALLNIALDTYMQEITPDLPTDKRYTGAMTASALGMALRRLNSPDPGAMLIEGLGAESLATLSGDIRSGRISENTDPDLADQLMRYLKAELAISNPKLLARRKG